MDSRFLEFAKTDEGKYLRSLILAQEYPNAIDYSWYWDILEKKFRLTDNFNRFNFIVALISEPSDINDIWKQWIKTGEGYNENGTNCICSKENIKNVYFLTHIQSQITLQVGSKCIKKYCKNDEIIIQLKFSIASKSKKKLKKKPCFSCGQYKINHEYERNLCYECTYYDNPIRPNLVKDIIKRWPELDIPIITCKICNKTFNDRPNHNNTCNKCNVKKSNTIKFGKYKGKKYEELVEEDPYYCKWVMNTKTTYIQQNLFKTWLLENHSDLNELKKILNFGKYREYTYEDMLHIDSGYCNWVISNSTTSGPMHDFKCWLLERKKKKEEEKINNIEQPIVEEMEISEEKESEESYNELSDESMDSYDFNFKYNYELANI